MLKAMQELLDIRTANATGMTIEQVRTLNRLEAEHDRQAAVEYRRCINFGPFTRIDPFKVEQDERLGLPRVEFYDEAHWSAVVLADGSLDYKL